jgi:hypothetical protein
VRRAPQERNPVDCIHFYDKAAPEKGQWVGAPVGEERYEEECPKTFLVMGVRVFLKRSEVAREALHGFTRWRKSKNHHPPLTQLSGEDGDE